MSRSPFVQLAGLGAISLFLAWPTGTTKACPYTVEGTDPGCEICSDPEDVGVLGVCSESDNGCDNYNQEPHTFCLCSEPYEAGQTYCLGGCSCS